MKKSYKVKFNFKLMEFGKLESDESNPILSRFLSMMNHNRERLKRMLKNVTDEMLDYSPDLDKVETIATLLEHIAAVDWGWVFMDMGGQEMSNERFQYGFALRSWSTVDQIKGKTKDYYLKKLETVRDEVMAELSTFSDADLKREFRVADEDTIFTLEWCFYHLINHEAMHLGQISILKRLYSNQTK